MRYLRLYKYLMGHKLVNAARDDIPREFRRGFSHDAIFGAAKEAPPTKVDMIKYRPEIYDQEDENNPDTDYACGSCAVTGATNALNVKEGSYILNNYVDMWDRQLKGSYGADIKKGSSMSGQLQQLYDMDLISSHYFCNSAEEIHEALAKGHTIFTGSNRIDWRATRVDPYFVAEGTSYGHFFWGARSDAAMRTITWVQSYGKDQYDRGYFYMNWDDFPLLYTVVALVDKEDTPSQEKIEAYFEDYLDKNPQSGIIREILNRNRDDLSYKEKMVLFLRIVSK